VKPLPTVLELGKKEHQDQKTADDIPDDKRNEVKDNTVCEPHDDTQQQHSIIDNTNLTGTLQFINAHDLRENGKSREKTGYKTENFRR
jgi:hypothetical protein